MSSTAPSGATLTQLDNATRALIRLAAALAGSAEDPVRTALQEAHRAVPHAWVEELLLQTYLFAGFPRALNGMREWRRLVPSPTVDAGAMEPRDVTRDGEVTCARVYGDMYERLRRNIRALHPLLDDWMIGEGYGKVLSRPALDLERRELCIVAACAATGQDRQLQSHLHGARNAGASDSVVTGTLAALQDMVPEPYHSRATRLWERIRHDIH